jgi:hypothetical protein
MAAHNMNLNRLAVIVVCIGILCGLACFDQWVEIFKVRNAPITKGHIVARTQTKNVLGPVIDFSILLNGTDITVHSRASLSKRYIIPDDVSFRYSGDPSKRVILLGYEGKPLLVAALFWSLSLVVAFGVFYDKIGWRR